MSSVRWSWRHSRHTVHGSLVFVSFPLLILTLVKTNGLHPMFEPMGALQD